MEEALEATAKADGVDLLIVMTTFTPAPGGALQRQAAFFSPDAALADECAAFLVKATFPEWKATLGVDPSLALEPLDLPAGQGWAGAKISAFSQRNGFASRKQVQPAVAAFLESRAHA